MSVQLDSPNPVLRSKHRRPLSLRRQRFPRATLPASFSPPALPDSPPPGYQRAPPWPDSLWSVWRNNVPHSKMLKDPRNVLWMELRGNTWHFPHALTAMPEADGAERYVAQLRNFIPFGSRLRTALDIGAGGGGIRGGAAAPGHDHCVARPPRDGFRGQAQFALERGLPALVGILATMRLPFPSLAFDLVHCSHCQVPFGLPNGTHLFEVDRVLRAGGFFVLAGPPVRWPGRAAEWRTLRDKARALCWRLVAGGAARSHLAERAGGLRWRAEAGEAGGKERLVSGAKEYERRNKRGGRNGGEGEGGRQ
ncbi:unnamed protein product [Closterium sp. NIES-64]|nr:unnamed protein product [Closterium sp. NIES-64]